LNIKTHKIENIDDHLLEYAVIVTRYNNHWILVKHINRLTWEIPGGKREKNEKIIETATRELSEETGAIDFDIEQICVYSVNRNEEKSYGLLCYSEVVKFGNELENEIGELKEFDELPSDLTYPLIQAILFEEVLKFKKTNVELALKEN